MRLVPSLSAIATMATVAVIAATLSACGQTQKPPAEGKQPADGKQPAAGMPPPAPTPVITISSAQITDEIVRMGRIQAHALVDVRSRVAGQLQRVTFRDGATVQAGDLLAIIDPRPYQAARAAGVAAVAQAQAAESVAKSELARGRALRRADPEAITEQDLDRLIAQAAQAEASVLAAQARRIQAELELEWTELRAPISGRIGHVMVDAGNLVDRGQPSIAMISDDAHCEVVVALDESEAARLTTLTRSASVAIKVAVAGESGYPRSATVSFISPTAEAGAATVMMRAVLPNADGALRHGASARALIPLSTPRRVAVVPETAVMAQQTVRTVLVVPPTTPGAIVATQPRPIQLGARLDNGTREVTSGLAVGEWIVKDPVFPRVIPGTPIMIPMQTATAPEKAVR